MIETDVRNVGRAVIEVHSMGLCEDHVPRSSDMFGLKRTEGTAKCHLHNLSVNSNNSDMRGYSPQSLAEMFT